MDKKTLKHLRSLAHGLKPVVRVGQNGFTEAVASELDVALAHHELVKVKLSEGNKSDREMQLNTMCERVSAVCVQQIGHTATLYRNNPEKNVIDLTNVAR